MAAWVETLLVALVGGGGVKTVEWILASRYRDTELARGLRKDEHEIGSKIRDELRKEVESLRARTKEAEQTVEKLKDTGAHPVLTVVSVPSTGLKIPAPQVLATREVSEAELELRQWIRAEVSAQITELRSRVERMEQRLLDQKTDGPEALEDDH